MASAMMPIGSILGSSVRRWSKTSEFRAGMAALAWESVLGSEVARHVHLSRIQNGIAFVQTSSSAWAHQMVFLKVDILQKLGSLLGSDAITDIRVQRSHLKGSHESEGVPPDLSAEALAPEDDSNARRCAAEVQDPALRAVLEKAMGAALSRQRALQSRGWVRCETCNGLTDDPGRRCFLCRHQERVARHRRLVTLMLECPWLTYFDMLHHIPDLLQSEHSRTKGQMLRTIWSEVTSWETRRKPGDKLPDELRQKVLTYVMMRSGLPPRLLGEDAIEHFAGKRIRRLLEG